MQEDYRLILDLVVVIAAATLGGFLSSCLRQPVLVGYLLAGILVGPTGLGLIKEVIQVETLAQFGVTLLLFTLGVEVSIAQLRRVLGIGLGGGGLQILLTMSLTTALALLTGWVTSFAQGILLGAILSLSSTAVVMKSLAERDETGTPHGRAMLGILIVQDLAVGLMLALLPALGKPVQELGQALLRSTLEIGLFSLAALVTAVWIIPPFLRLLAQRESRELFLLGVISLCAGIALLTHRLGISSEIGAFVAGLMVSEVEYADQTLDYVEPLRDLFAALFFAAIGMLIDPSFIAAHITLILSLVGLVILGKWLIVVPLTRMFRYSWQVSILVGLGLAQIGEFSFVLASKGQALGLLSRQLYLLIISTTAVTLLVSPLLMKLVPLLFTRLEQSPGWGKQLATDYPREIATSALQDHVVICGYGQVGWDMVRLLESRCTPLLVIDQSERVIQQLRQRQVPYVYGNAASALVLERAHLEAARAMVIALPDRMSTRLCLKRSLELAPQLTVVVRALHREDVELLYQLGAAEVVQPEWEASLELSSYVLQTLGEPLAKIQQDIMEIRHSHYADLRPQPPSCLIRPLPVAESEWFTSTSLTSLASFEEESLPQDEATDSPIWTEIWSTGLSPDPPQAMDQSVG